MSDYTNEQIRQAVLGMPMMKRHRGVAQWELNMFRQFLDALPDLPDDWVPCEFSEIRKGDRVKRVLTRPSGSIVTKEGVAHLLDGQIWDTQDGVSLASPHHIPASEGRVDVYRIPAPVVRPDPEEHPVILVHAFDGDSMPAGTYASITQNQAHGYVYELVPGDGTHPIRTRPDAIDEWEPAKVVPANYPTRTIAPKGVNP